ncbi:MAG TPA: ECF-type sigma factor [Rhodanobacteraceae bacterium]|nr:ECF-type sigma factor [Rhodanobacteraceae bacterium]
MGSGTGHARTSEASDALASTVLFAEVYDRLKAMAATQLRARAGHTLDTTELVHELYLRMNRGEAELAFEHPAQFFAYAARAMRHLLINRARDRLRLRASGHWQRVTLDDHDLKLAIDSAEQALALDAALEDLQREDPRAAQAVELRYFAGLTLEQIAETLGVARRTVDRDWRFARAFIGTRIPHP